MPHNRATTTTSSSRSGAAMPAKLTDSRRSAITIGATVAAASTVLRPAHGSIMDRPLPGEYDYRFLTRPEARAEIRRSPQAQRATAAHRRRRGAQASGPLVPLAPGRSRTGSAKLERWFKLRTAVRNVPMPAASRSCGRRPGSSATAVSPPPGCAISRSPRISRPATSITTSAARTSCCFSARIDRSTGCWTR